MKFILASANKNKIQEIQDILGREHTLQTAINVGFTEDILEYGDTFSENAIIKAKALQNFAIKDCDYVLADDSGIEIDALDKKPGVNSARWLGVNTPYNIKNRRIIDLLADVPYEKRTARFISVIVCIAKNGKIEIIRGTLEGYISMDTAGEHGFGYDPIFFVPEYNCNLAQLTTYEKNNISHRGKAIRDLFKVIL
ncbi:MAG: RdgB/HAM1 family non-canonical purine NTP pyrophosphatase [Firmicutes bacterium]|nr:RdgB/HAM1 family non-canonical purine NTP pyrophosphatase [Bacillota bacterium]